MKIFQVEEADREVLMKQWQIKVEMDETHRLINENEEKTKEYADSLLLIMRSGSCVK